LREFHIWKPTGGLSTLFAFRSSLANIYESFERGLVRKVCHGGELFGTVELKIVGSAVDRVRIKK
jgi:hypothetical protein